MTKEEYSQHWQKINKKLREDENAELHRIRDEYQAKRQSLYESLNNLWAFENNEPIPEINANHQFAESELEEVHSTFQDNDNSVVETKDNSNRNDKLRDIVRKMSQGSDVTSLIVFDIFQNKYPELAPELVSRKTIISKVLRKMAEKGVLEKVSDGVGNTSPTLYRKL
jgi:hypothetical protein